MQPTLHYNKPYNNIWILFSHRLKRPLSLALNTGGLSLFFGQLALHTLLKNVLYTIFRNITSNCDLTKWPVELFSQEVSIDFLLFRNVHLSRHHTSIFETIKSRFMSQQATFYNSFSNFQCCQHIHENEVTSFALDYKNSTSDKFAFFALYRALSLMFWHKSFEFHI